VTLDLLKKEQMKTAQGAPSDKRYFPRWEVNRRGEFQEEKGISFLSFTKDLSMEGASIIALGNPGICNPIRIRIHLEDKASFEAQGRIVWSKSEPTHKLFGIVFDKLSKKASQLIMHHAFELGNDHVSLSRTK